MGGTGGERTWATVHFFLLLKKTDKVQEHDLYLNQILHHFELKFFRGLQGALFLFLYKVIIVVLIDFIAILLTPGIFLIQIVNTNNKNWNLIHFHGKNNVKIHFPKSWVFSFKPTPSIHYPSQHGEINCSEINCVDISKDFKTACRWNMKKIYI